MSLINPNDLASPEELQRREETALGSGDFFNQNRAGLVEAVKAEIENGSGLAKSLEGRAEDLKEFGVANNPEALANAVVDSWQQSATQGDWGAYRDAQAILSGDREYADMNINDALKVRGVQLYEGQARSSPDEMVLTEAQKEEIRADLAGAPRAQQGLTADQFVQLEDDGKRAAIQDTANALGKINGERYFDQLGFPGERIDGDIKAFQEAHGMAPDGRIDAELLNAIKAEAQSQGNQDALNALNKVTTVAGFTPPEAVYDVPELSNDEKAKLWQEAKDEAAQIRAERAEGQEQPQPATQQTAAAAPILAATSAVLWGDEAPAAPNPSPLQAPAATDVAQAVSGSPDRPEASASVSGYKIEKGDTLYEIAENNLRQNGIAISPATVQEEVQRLAELNNIKDPDKIFAGTEIQLNDEKQPDSPALVASKPVETTPPPPAAEQQQAQTAAEEAEQKRQQAVDAAWGKAQSVASIFGFGGMMTMVKELSTAMNEPEKSIAKGEPQGVQIADGTPVSPLPTPGGRQRAQEMTV